MQNIKRIIVILFSIMLVLSLGYVVVNSMLDPTPEANSESTPHIRKYVHSLGRLEPRGTVVRVSAPSGNEGACIASLMVTEGEDVIAGQVIAILDTRDRRRGALIEAEANVIAAKAKLAQVVAGMKQGDIDAAHASKDLATAQMRVAKRELERAQKLVSANAFSEEEFEVRRWALERATLEVQRTEGLLASTREIRTTDVEAQRAQVMIAEAAVETAKSNYAVTSVVAPFDSRILKIHAWPGERPNESGVCDVGCVSQMQAVAEVYEADIALLEVGQPATIQVETLGMELNGVVAELGYMVARKVILTNDPVSDTDARVVEVRVDIDPDQIGRVVRLSNARVQVQFSIESNRSANTATEKQQHE
jgi:HlyD family secretion protein